MIPYDSGGFSGGFKSPSLDFIRNNPNRFPVSPAVQYDPNRSMGNHPMMPNIRGMIQNPQFRQLLQRLQGTASTGINFMAQFPGNPPTTNNFMNREHILNNHPMMPNRIPQNPGFNRKLLQNDSWNRKPYNWELSGFPGHHYGGMI